MGALHDDQNSFLFISHEILLRMRNVSDRSCREIRNTFYVQYIYIYIYILNYVVYEIMWKNIVKPDRLQMTI